MKNEVTEAMLEENDRILREHLGEDAWAEITEILEGENYHDV